MTSYWKESLKLFGLHVMFAIVSILFLGSFSFVATSEVGSKIYSAVTALLYLSTLYSFVWQAGRKDVRYLGVLKKHLENEADCEKINPWKGLWIGLLASIPSFIMLGLFIHASHAGGMYYVWVNVSYRIYQAAFLSWLGNDNLSYFWNCVVVTVLVPLLSGVAYFMGTRQFSITERYLPGLIYKKKKTDKENKKRV